MVKRTAAWSPGEPYILRTRGGRRKLQEPRRKVTADGVWAGDECPEAVRGKGKGRKWRMLRHLQDLWLKGKKTQ